MHHGDVDSRQRVKQRALAATGLVATAAAGGLGVAAVTAAEAQAASGVVHACYNKSTHALKYTKTASCPKGSKLVTWSKAGPQGGAGAKGAQGPQGPTGPAGWAGERYFNSLFFSAGSPTIAASFTPTSAGYFAVNGWADIYPYGNEYYGCWDEGGAVAPGNHNYTPQDFVQGYTDRQLGNATGGIITAGPTTPVYEYCSGSHSGSVYDGAEVTGVHLTAAQVTAEARKAPAGRVGQPRSGSKKTAHNQSSKKR
jgi:hypothetical protein